MVNVFARLYWYCLCKRCWDEKREVVKSKAFLLIMIILNWLFRKYSIFEFGRKILMSLLPFFLQIVSIKRYNFWHYSRYLTDQITCHFFKQVWKSGSHMQLRNVTLKSKPGPWKRLNVFLRQIASFFTCDQSVWHLNKALCQDFFGFYIFYLKARLL